MNNQNTLQKTKERMRSILETKAMELEKISAIKDEVNQQILEATNAMKMASELMDVDSYAKATNAKNNATTALKMYDERLSHIQEYGYVSEEESDRVIDELLDFEKLLAKNFHKDIIEPMDKLRKIYSDYINTIDDVEKTIKDWCRDIHANYNSRGGTKWTDPKTGKLTDRSEKPIPVHITAYIGSEESQLVRDFICTYERNGANYNE